MQLLEGGGRFRRVCGDGGLCSRSGGVSTSRTKLGASLLALAPGRRIASWWDMVIHRRCVMPITQHLWCAVKQAPHIALVKLG